ncbi:hypothetical protein EELLY_v1c02680 [Entomoplasma ellychniae]|uniref:Uncharacterized protein n=1 Tax=Entomoplasma ellychniae TaxID=2114 RepID=A0A8E2QX92_9MOLU|nr:hypothetical protein [Entomoplasma ellychniae]PPE04588.1 hypothetical protein EELLY_v1c02680 [Entomoplasma ellychniae]
MKTKKIKLLLAILILILPICVLFNNLNFSKKVKNDNYDKVEIKYNKI